MHRGGIRGNRREESFDGGDRNFDRRDRQGNKNERHPSGLTGKEIGLWYAARGSAGRKKKELKERPIVSFHEHHERRVRSFLHQSSKDPSPKVEEQIDDVTDTGKDEEIWFDQSLLHHSLMNEQIKKEEIHLPASCTLKRDAVLNEKFRYELDEKRASSQTFKKMMEFRKLLPSYRMKDELLKLIKSSQVILISGETGCGKTTQVAQFILDDAIDHHAASQCHIICTQPRRISAISVAQRVAKERGEACGSASVGFQIRLESELPRQQGSILYCTTGILLRRLLSDSLLSNVSHIVLDEIHERDLFSDFFLIIVKDLLKLRPDIKLILMSATLNSEMFSGYFDNCPSINVPGFTYPVVEHFLEDIYEMLKYNPPMQSQSRHAARRRQRRFHNKKGHPSEHEKKELEREQFNEYLNNLSRRSEYSPRTLDGLANADLDQIDFRLIETLIRHICTSLGEGAILVFLPGWDDITKLHDVLKNNPVFGSDNYRIIPLHSLMPTAFQQQVFDRPPTGIRKIVIATNIAETSITIDDVVFVIDSGKTKKKTYDTVLNISCLQPVWISKASMRQRRGRAGRVQPGHCFHLFTKFQTSLLADYQDPEMLRTPLEELSLQVKILNLGKIEAFLSKALQPPSSSSLQNAIASLTELNALDADENLTPLGYHLAKLPVDPKVGKMILFGAILACLDPVLTVASSLGFKDPFIIPLHKQKEADSVRMKFAKDSFSDHIMLANAYDEWEKIQQTEPFNVKRWCWDNFLSMNTLKMIKNMKLQFARLLHEIGFLSTANCNDKEANIHSGSTKLVKAVICAGLYPNVAKAHQQLSNKRPPKLETKQDGRVMMHPKSVNSEITSFESQWFIYHLKMKTSKIFLYDTTMIAPFPLVFFGGRISTGREDFQNIIKVDDWIKFQASKKIAELVKDLRVKLDQLLEQKIKNPSLKISAGNERTEQSEGLLFDLIIDLITTEEIQKVTTRP